MALRLHRCAGLAHIILGLFCVATEAQWSTDAPSGASITPEGSQTDDLFGARLCVGGQGNRMAVAAYRRTPHGAVDIFHRTSATASWNRTQTLTGSIGSSAQASDFGYQLSCVQDGRLLLVAAPNSGDVAQVTGSLWVFEYNNVTSEYSQIQRVDPLPEFRGQGINGRLCTQMRTSNNIVACSFAAHSNNQSIFLYSQDPVTGLLSNTLSTLGVVTNAGETVQDFGDASNTPTSI